MHFDERAPSLTAGTPDTLSASTRMKSRPGGSQRLPPGPGASLRLRASSNPLFPASRAHRLLHIILLLFLLCFLSSLTQALSSLIYVGNMYLSVKSQLSRCESAFHLQWQPASS